VPDPDSPPAAADVAPAEEPAAPTKEQKVEAAREQLLSKLAAAKLDELQERVAWLLNHHPRTRDSDIALQLEYWAEFEPELSVGDSIAKEDLYKLTRLTSLTRARAKIQNTYKLFQASAEVRAARGTLAEEEKVKAAEQQIEFPVFDVYMDETGKQGAHLIVASVWCLHPVELLQFRKDVAAWRADRKFNSELHFKDITNRNVAHYFAFADLLKEKSAVFSFKAVSVERAGVKNVDDALQELYFHLLVRGVEHEHDTGRAPLPRALQVWKDQEEPGRDKLFMAALRERVIGAAAARFQGHLGTEEFFAVDSRRSTPLQVADLYTSSINRVRNAEGQRAGPKDQFADYLLGLLGLPRGPEQAEQVGDMATLISL
jgi:hypothetical protein